MAERIGRPPRDPYDIIDYRETLEEGGVTRTPVRVIDRVEETLRANAFIHDAAARAGLATETLRTWRTKGQRASADLLAGRKRRSDLDRHTKQCIELANRMERAEADSRTALMSHMTRLASGGMEKTRVVVKIDAATQQELDRTETTERLLPDASSIGWLLTHRWPADFSTRVEVTGAQGGPIEVEVSARDRLMESILAVRERRDSGAEGGKVLDVPVKALPNGSDPDED